MKNPPVNRVVWGGTAEDIHLKKILYFIYDLEIADYCEKLTINYLFT